jgi:hypothetical protein
MEGGTPKVGHDSVLKTKSRISISSVDKNNIGTLRKLLYAALTAAASSDSHPEANDLISDR